MLKSCKTCILRYHCDEMTECNCRNNDYSEYSKDERLETNHDNLSELKEDLLELFYEYNSEYNLFCDGCLGKDPRDFHDCVHKFAEFLICRGVTIKDTFGGR